MYSAIVKKKETAGTRAKSVHFLFECENCVALRSEAGAEKKLNEILFGALFVQNKVIIKRAHN